MEAAGTPEGPMNSVQLWFERVSGVVIAVLVVLLAVSLAHFTWFILAGSPPTITQGPELAASSNSAQPVRLNMRQLQQWHLFGKAGEAPKPTRAKRQENLVKTSLRLTLEGVFLADDPEKSSAIIAEQGKPGLFYRVSDRVPGNAVLDRVEEDQVVLDRNGRLEVLRFPKTADLGISGQKKKKRTTVSRSSRGKNKKIDPRKIARESLVLGSDKMTELFINSGGMPAPKDVVAAISDEITKDPDGFMGQMGLTPRSMGKGGGYQIMPNAPGELLRMIGLREGDVIKSINNQPLGNVNDDVRLLQAYSDGECEISLEIEKASNGSIISWSGDICSGQLF